MQNIKIKTSDQNKFNKTLITSLGNLSFDEKGISFIDPSLLSALQEKFPEIEVLTNEKGEPIKMDKPSPQESELIKILRKRIEELESEIKTLKSSKQIQETPLKEKKEPSKEVEKRILEAKEKSKQELMSKLNILDENELKALAKENGFKESEYKDLKKEDLIKALVEKSFK